MLTTNSWIKRIGLTLALCTLGTVALAHSTGNERRTPAECAKLAETKPAEKQWCLDCVAKTTEKAKFHYHPDYPAGNRCRPDDGKP